MQLYVGADNPKSVLVPKGIAHAYPNVGSESGIVINCPNRLYMGTGKREEIDEIRYERGWLAELFRHDDMDAKYFPTMS